MDVLTLLYTVVFTVIGWVDGCPHTSVYSSVYSTVIGWVDGCPHTTVYSSVYSNRVGGWMSSHYCIIGWVDLRDYMNVSRIFVICVLQFWTYALLQYSIEVL